MASELSSASKHLISFRFFPPYDVFFSVFFIQYEAKMKTLETNMKEMESKKRILEEAVDSLNEEIAKLKAKGNGQYPVESFLTVCLIFPRAFNSSLIRQIVEIQHSIVTPMLHS